MRLLIAAVGRLKAGPERELLDRYVERANAAGRAVSLGPLEISEIAESQDRRPSDRMADEARRLEAALPNASCSMPAARESVATTSRPAWQQCGIRAHPAPCS